MNRGHILSGLTTRASTYAETYEADAVHVGTGGQASPTQMLGANRANLSYLSGVTSKSQPPPRPNDPAPPASGSTSNSDSQMKTGLMIAGAAILLWWLMQ